MKQRFQQCKLKDVSTRQQIYDNHMTESVGGEVWA